MLLAALVQLNQTSPDVSYTEAAKSIASATIDYLSDANGIIGECRGGCDTTGQQFKGGSYAELADSSAGRSEREVRDLHPEECRQRVEYGEGSHD